MGSSPRKHAIRATRQQRDDAYRREGTCIARAQLFHVVASSKSSAEHLYVCTYVYAGQVCLYEGTRLGTAAALQTANKDYLMRLGAEASVNSTRAYASHTHPRTHARKCC